MAQFRRFPLIFVPVCGVLMLVLFLFGHSRPTEAHFSEQSGRDDAPFAGVSTAERQLSTPELIEAAVARGEISRDLGDLYLAYALFAPERLPARFRSNTPWDGTLPLWELQQRQRARPPSFLRSTIETLAATSCGSSSSGNLPKSHTSTHFYIEYKQIKGGLTINDYANALETAWDVEITQFGWAAPPMHPSAPSGKYHVRVDALGTGLFGYVSSSGTYAGLVGDNPNTSWNDQTAYATCMVLRNDFSGFPSPALKALQATAAHEFHHAVQFGYGVLTNSIVPDGLFVEASATWIEDEVFDDANDNYNYLWPDFQTCMGEHYPGNSNQWYPYWVVLRGLTERYGTGTANGGEQVMQDFWEYQSKQQYEMLEALDQALQNKGTSLGETYHAAAIALKFNKPCGSGYTYPYCFEEANGYTNTAGQTAVTGNIASVGGSYTGSIQDNYTLDWIELPASGGPYTVTLQNTSSGGQLRASVVGDTGSSLDVRSLGVAAAGQTIQVSNINPANYTSSPILVVTNEAQTAANPSSCTGRSYKVTVSKTASVPTTQFVFLPFITRGTAATAGISGRVTLNGSPVGGVGLELRFYNGSAWSTLMTTTTASDGTYRFTNVPSLSSGQKYYVRYVNPSLNDSQGRLAAWGTRELTSYTAGTAVDLGTFDIADVTLVSPPPGASVTLPTTFSWNPRSATPQDSYGVAIYSTSGSLVNMQPPVGYTGSYTMNSLPSGVSAGTTYLWSVYILWADGSVGLAYWGHSITFNTSRLVPGAPDSARLLTPVNPVEVLEALRGGW